MSERIKGIGFLTPAGPSSSTGARETRAGSAPTDGVKGKSFDRIDVSNIAVSLHKLDSFMRDLPIVDNQKIVEIRGQISAGRYEIDGMRLARNFLTLELAYHQSGFKNGLPAIA